MPGDFDPALLGIRDVDFDRLSGVAGKVAPRREVDDERVLCFFFVVCMCFNVHRNNKEFLLPLILTMRRHCCTYVRFSYFYAFS